MYKCLYEITTTTTTTTSNNNNNDNNNNNNGLIVGARGLQEGLLRERRAARFEVLLLL